MTNEKATPFVKWAGGKRQLLPAIRERLPESFENYIEPFVGGGAVFFELTPENSTINDINKALVNTYTTIRDNPVELMKALDVFDQGISTGDKEYYYSTRELYNNKLVKNEYDVELAALFIFLNKHCFNGLYRVNSKGLFNVPYNQSKSASYVESNILNISALLKNATITHGDFEEVCKKAKKGDFVFFDSPYAPLNPTSFESYTKEGFDIESHERLAKLFGELTKKGCYCMLTNHNTDLIQKLYAQYNLEVVDVKRMINSKADKRTGQEVIVRNY